MTHNGTNHYYDVNKEEKGGLRRTSDHIRCSTKRVKLSLSSSKSLQPLQSRPLAVDSGYVQIPVQIVLHVNPVACCHCARVARFRFSSSRQSHVELSRREEQASPVDRES